VAAKRSPILGYNHNVRYRGVIFHVQTEDSGIHNPHVFTHLFHGGIILSTRKLVYDADAAEEAVKSLMQAQHKAALKELKNGRFDAKIDQLLVGIEGLLPRGHADEGSGRAETVDDLSQPTAVPDPASRPTERLSAESTIATIAASSAGLAAGTVPGGRVGEPRMVTQPRVASSALPPIPPRTATPSRAIPPPVPGTVRAAGTESETDTERVSRKREVSDAFQAIVVPDQDLADAGLLDELEPAQVHSPAPASAALPPGAAPTRPGSYAQHRRRDTGAIGIPEGLEDEGAGAVASATAAPRAHRPSEAGEAAPRPRTPTPSSGPARVTPARTVMPSGRVPVQPPPVAARPHPASQPPPATARTVTQPARMQPPSAPPMSQRPGGVPPGGRTRAPTAGNVVLSRPAVIIGAPTKMVGSAPPMPSARGTQSQTRVRKAREDSESGMFGQDLISEKSLDEVILAYLSEDAGEE
jgi:hypothetical protein